jgi:hypothetical protein
MLTDRELASFFWLGLVGVWALSHPDIRKRLGAVLRAALHPKLLIPLLVYAAYLAALVFGARRIGLWNPNLTKDTTIWFLGSGVALVFSINVASEDGFFAHAVWRALGVGAFLEFYLNLVALPLLWELVLQPILMILVLLSAAAGTNPSYKPVKAGLNGLLALIGGSLIIITGGQLVHDWASLDGPQVLRRLFLPGWLTLGAFPFIYGLSLYSNYEIAFMRIGFATKDARARRRAKIALLIGLHIRNRSVHSFVGAWVDRLASAPAFGDARRVVAEYRAAMPSA